MKTTLSSLTLLGWGSGSGFGSEGLKDLGSSALTGSGAGGFTAETALLTV